MNRRLRLSTPITMGLSIALFVAILTTFTASYTVTQADIDAGSFTNTAVVSGTPPSGPDVADKASETVETRPCDPPLKTWTNAADFAGGYSFNLETVQEGDDACLQLLDEIRAWPYIAIANSGDRTLVSPRDTLVRVDVNTGNVVGEYLSRPGIQGPTQQNDPYCMQGDPSRTTVDAYGNVWVGNRSEGLYGNPVADQGSVTRIGLVVGGTRAFARGDPKAVYITNPDYCTCEDRDHDGFIRTSRGYPWGTGALDDDYKPTFLPWPNTAGLDSDGGVDTAEDECITAYVRVAGTSVRFVAVDPVGDVWTGGRSNHVFQKIDGATATAMPGFIFNSTCGGYGGLVDPSNVIWSATWTQVTQN